MITPRHPGPEAISAFADGEIDAADARSLEAHLRGCEACSARVRRVRAEKVAVLRAVRTSPGAPPALAARLSEMASLPPERGRRRIGAALASVALAGALALSAWLALRAGRTLPSDLRDELALDHLHYLPIANPAQVASDDPRVVAAGLEARLGRGVVVPSWEATKLLGGRACHIHRDLVPLVLYERAGHRVSFFALRNVEVSKPGCDKGEGGLSVCARPMVGGGAFVAVADLPAHEVSRLLDLTPGS